MILKFLLIFGINLQTVIHWRYRFYQRLILRNLNIVIIGVMHRSVQLSSPHFAQIDNIIIYAFKIIIQSFQSRQVNSNIIYKKFLPSQLLIMQSDSDSQTIEQMHSPITIEYLVNQNKMKQIALNKATNLIDLLKIQLEVQRNSHQEAIQIIQEDLQYKYQHQIMRLNSKISQLQNELKNKKNCQNQVTSRKSRTFFQQPNNSKIEKSKSKFKTKDIGRQSPMMRTNNSEQLQKQKKRKYSNKKVISKNSISLSNNGVSQNAFQQSSQKLLKFDKNLLISWILNVQKKYQLAFQTMAQQYQSNFSQAVQQKQKIKANMSQVSELLQKQKKKWTVLQKKQSEYKRFINQQQELILYLSKQLDQIQQEFSNMNYELSSLINSNKNQEQMNISFISSRYILQDLSVNQNYIRTILLQNRKRINNKVQMMENQNTQLKDILDNMIRLVKNNKKLHIQ